MGVCILFLGGCLHSLSALEAVLEQHLGPGHGHEPEAAGRLPGAAPQWRRPRLPERSGGLPVIALGQHLAAAAPAE